MKITKKDIVDIERYKRQIDEDFETFPNNKRLVKLIKSWISTLSNDIMTVKRSGQTAFIHNDRKKLRKELIKYLNQKNNTRKYPIRKK